MVKSRRDELLDQAETLQNLLIARATGGIGDDAEYRQLRQVFLVEPSLEPLLPRFVRTCRNLFQFWEYIKYQFSTYADRRQYLWDEFRPLIDAIEKGALAPSDDSISTVLESFDASSVHAIWSKALDRRQTDPEGAITMARTLLETVCKHVLDELSIQYDDGADLPKLYRAVSDSLNLSPGQHTEPVFKQILGGCTSVVEGLGALRNRLSDSHGKGKRAIRPAARHAELAVNLAGAVATYIIATWEVRQDTTT